MDKIDIDIASVDQAVAAKLTALNARAKQGFSWFQSIALFSVLNSVLGFFKVSLGFLIGLGITQVVDGFAIAFFNASEGSPLGIVIRVIGVTTNLFIAGMFLLIHRASAKYLWLAITGCVMYALDAVLLAAFGDWLPVAFHVFALFMISGGIKAQREANAISRQAAP